MTAVMEIAERIQALMETDPKEALRLTTDVLPAVVRDGSVPVVEDVRKKGGRMSDYECDMWGEPPERYVYVLVDEKWRHLGRLYKYKTTESQLREKLCGLTFERAKEALYSH